MEVLKSAWDWIVAHWAKLLIAAAIIESGRRMIGWLIKRLHDNVDNAILAVLRVDEGIFGKLIVELSKETGIEENKIASGLLRLEAAGRVHAKSSRGGQRWYFGPRGTGNDFRFKIHGQPVS